MEESKVILDIPLSPCKWGDKLIWSLTEHGRYIAKSDILQPCVNYSGQIYESYISENVKNFF